MANCVKCKRELTPANAIARKDSATGFKSRCKECSNERARERYGEKTAKPDKAPTWAPPESKWASVAAFDAIVKAGAGLDLPYETPAPAPRIVTIEETITQVEEHRLKKRVRDLESEKQRLIVQLSDGGEYAEIVAEVLAKQGERVARIAPRERTSGLAEATPLVLASDWHIEHEIRPEQVAGRNRFNLEISAQRMERFFEATRWAINHQREVPFKIRDMILWLGGDFIQNYLHEDDNESNLLSPTEAILYAQVEIEKGIRFLLEDNELEQIVIPCNDGNHGRLTDKTRSSTRIENSLEALLYAQLARAFASEPRVRFILPTSQFTFLDDVYGRTIRFLHGDVFNYSGGVGGITVPMLRAEARWQTVKHADLTCMGHWHQRICLPRLMVNGSLCGYDPYAMGGGFPFEQPVQAMRMLDSKRFCSTDIPLWVSVQSDDDANNGR